MKTMTCNQLGGACEKEFHANTFEEIVEISKNHGMEMYQSGDEAHIKVMKEMVSLMTDPPALKKWMDGKRKEFYALPDN